MCRNELFQIELDKSKMIINYEPIFERTLNLARKNKLNDDIIQIYEVKVAQTDLFYKQPFKVHLK
jgi:hypothetical protein